MRPSDSITDVPGIEVGHAQDDDALTGCTVILCRQGAVAGVDVRGGAPGTRETDLLNPLNLVDRVHAVMLAGGSAYGLDAASGTMRFLEEQGIGFETPSGVVPIVPAAVVFDLGLGRADVRPDAAMGYAACRAASTASVVQGNLGAGTGASVGKILGLERAMKSGVGSASITLGSGIVVGALAAVNALGDVVDPSTGAIVAGARAQGTAKPGESGYFADTLEVMRTSTDQAPRSFGVAQNTTLAVVAVNAALNKAQAAKVAQMAQDGLARAVRPAHTMFDGDTVFALATGGAEANVSILGACSAEALSIAIVRAARMAASAGGLPGLYQSGARV
ncbi:MAG TPA: P1 family peptidase [Anaerolineales bacterium]